MMQEPFKTKSHGEMVGELIKYKRAGRVHHQDFWQRIGAITDNLYCMEYKEYWWTLEFLPGTDVQIAMKACWDLHTLVKGHVHTKFNGVDIRFVEAE